MDPTALARQALQRQDAIPDMRPLTLNIRLPPTVQPLNPRAHTVLIQGVPTVPPVVPPVVRPTIPALSDVLIRTTTAAMPQPVPGPRTHVAPVPMPQPVPGPRMQVAPNPMPQPVPGPQAQAQAQARNIRTAAHAAIVLPHTVPRQEQEQEPQRRRPVQRAQAQRIQAPAVTTTDWITQRLPAPELDFVRVVVPELPQLQVADGVLTVTKNPYIHLSERMFRNIKRERDVTVPDVHQLFMYDTIMPDWLNRIARTRQIDLVTLNGVDLRVWAGIHEIPTPAETDNMVNNEFRTFLCVMLDLRQTANVHIRNFNVGTALRRLCVKLHFNISDDDMQFFTDSYIETAYVSRSVDSIMQAIALIKPRCEFLRTHTHHEIFVHLYNTNNFQVMAGKRKRVIEDVIVRLDDLSDAEVMNHVGMLVPLSHTRNIRAYIKNNIAEYADVFERQIRQRETLESLVFRLPNNRLDYLNKLKDQEIMDLMGVYVSYNSRRELVDGMLALFDHHDRFMYPIQRSTARSINATTFMGDPITDTNLFMVCYGKPLSYTTYEVDELYNAFSPDDIGNIEFRDPWGKARIGNPGAFADDDIQRLMKLLECFPATPEITQLLQRLTQGLSQRAQYIEGDATAKAAFNRLHPDEKMAFKEFLMNIFTCGMYMRRWKGPGHPYPIKERETNIKALPDVEVSELLTKHEEYLKVASNSVKSLYRMLAICTYKKDGNIDVGFSKFDSLWNGVRTNKECIRMASIRFVGTGYHYLQVLCGVTIPGLEVQNLDRIV